MLLRFFYIPDEPDTSQILSWFSSLHMSPATRYQGGPFAGHGSTNMDGWQRSFATPVPKHKIDDIYAKQLTIIVITGGPGCFRI